MILHRQRETAVMKCNTLLMPTAEKERGLKENIRKKKYEALSERRELSKGGDRGVSCIKSSCVRGQREGRGSTGCECRKVKVLKKEEPAYAYPLLL